jgi:hypothetical protein
VIGGNGTNGSDQTTTPGSRANEVHNYNGGNANGLSKNGNSGLGGNGDHH